MENALPKSMLRQVCLKGLYLVLYYFYSLLTTSLVKYLQALSLAYLPTTALFTEKSHQTKIKSFSNGICQHLMLGQKDGACGSTRPNATL